MSMSAKPKDAIAALRHYMADRVWPDMPAASLGRVLAWADSIPDGAVPVVWPAELTRERLEELAERPAWAKDRDAALRALAAIAPVRKKRGVNLWQRGAGTIVAIGDNDCPLGDAWRCVARNVELED